MAKLKPFVTDQQWIRLEPWRPRLQPWEEQGVWPKYGLGKRARPWKDQRREGGMVVVDGQQCLSIGADLDSASASEIKLQQPTIEKIAVPRKGGGRPRQNPVRIIADKGYDSDPLGQRRSKGGIELICR